MNKSSLSPSLLVIGGTKAGKTHYGGQLLRRLEAKKYRLHIVGAPSDLTPFLEVLNQLAQGKSASHTPSGFYRESIWQVRRADDAEESSDLIWPDYAGEQIEEIVKNRQVSEQWIQRIRASNGWLLFVRLRPEMKPEDILDRPRKRERMQSPSDGKPSASEPVATEGTEVGQSELPKLTFQKQAGLIELLQALLFIKQVGSTNQLHNPPLVVVLSCWDEISEPKPHKPAELLKSYLPMLSQFIEATWQPERVEILGLSALGKPLSDDISDDEFMDNGPERQGWCISANGEKTDDLTLPVVALMDKAGTER